MKAAALLVFLLVAAMTAAYPPYWEAFEEHYKPKGDIAKAECNTCHSPTTKTIRNAYGKQIERALKESKAESLTVQLLQIVEKEDANGDGISNLEEIQAGRLPAAPAAKTAPPKPGDPAGNKDEELLPRHSFHPLVVHFPVALYLFGVVLDFYGRWRRSDEIRRVAMWNLGFGALASLLAVPTGLAVWLRSGYPLEGNVLNHFVLAITAAILMLSMAAWRRKGLHDSGGYWLLLLISGVTVAAAGHFGAAIVFG